MKSITDPAATPIDKPNAIYCDELDAFLPKAKPKTTPIAEPIAMPEPPLF